MKLNKPKNTLLSTITRARGMIYVNLLAQSMYCIKVRATRARKWKFNMNTRSILVKLDLVGVRGAKGTYEDKKKENARAEHFVTSICIGTYMYKSL